MCGFFITLGNSRVAVWCFLLYYIFLLQHLLQRRPSISPPTQPHAHQYHAGYNTKLVNLLCGSCLVNQRISLWVGEECERTRPFPSSLPIFLSISFSIHVCVFILPFPFFKHTHTDIYISVENKREREGWAERKERETKTLVFALMKKRKSEEWKQTHTHTHCILSQLVWWLAIARLMRKRERPSAVFRGQLKITASYHLKSTNLKQLAH